MKPIEHAYLKMIKRKISPLNSITLLKKTSSLHALYGFIGGRIFWSMYDKIKCIFLFLANYRMLIHSHFFVGFFFLILFWAWQNCTFSISIWYIFTYLTLNWMKVVWKHIFENRIYKIFPYILWIKFWCFRFKHSTIILPLLVKAISITLI